MQDIRTELAEILDEAEWDWLIPHVQRDVVVIITPELDLLEVGVAIASDNLASVQQWIEQGKIGKPSTDQLSTWNQNRQKRFKALIVQPYVLAQEKNEV